MTKRPTNDATPTAYKLIAWGPRIGAVVVALLVLKTCMEIGDDNVARAPVQTPTPSAAQALPADLAARLLWKIEDDKDVPIASKEAVRLGAMKVLADERNCGKVVAGGRSTTRQGAFYVMCEPRNGGGTVFNVWFTPEQAMGGAPLAVATAYPEAPAREACERAIRAQVNNPSTLDLHRVTGYATTVHNNGNRTVLQDFSAKNALGLEAGYQARCLVQPTGVVEVTITDAQ